MSDNQIFTIRRDPTLFVETRKYHNRAMKRLFLKYYEPLSTNGKVNKNWTISMSKTDMYDLRIHLSWVIGINTFDWKDYKVGKKILRIYQETNQFLFLNHLIKIRNSDVHVHHNGGYEVCDISWPCNLYFESILSIYGK